MSKHYMRRRYPTLLLVVLALIADSPPPSAEPRALHKTLLSRAATYEQILQSLRATDPMLLTNHLSALRLYRREAAVRTLLTKVWERDKRGIEDLSWDLLDAPAQRVVVAFALHRDDANAPVSFREYIRSQLATGDADAQRNAAMAIGIIGSNSDISSLRTLILDGDEQTASRGASGLILLGTEPARKALEALSATRSISKEKREIIERALRNPSWR